MIDVRSKIDQARAHFEGGRAEQARALLERSLRQTPGHPDLSNAMSLVLLGMGRLDLALYHAERAVQARPHDPGFLQNLANALTQLGRLDEAIVAYERVLAADPGAVGARLGISHALRLRYRFADATAHLHQALKFAPDDVDLLGALAPLLLKQARVEEAVEAAERGVQIRPGDLGCAPALAHCLNYLPGADAARVLGAHREAGRAYSAAAQRRFTAHRNTPEPSRRIRVGLLSGDLRRHAISFFLEPFLEHHDRGSIEVACYSTTTHEDEVTARLRSHAALWRDLKGAAPGAIAEAIHRDGVDVLVELAGHAAGHNLPAVVMKPAPVQVDYLGYPATTGVPEVDFRIVDSLTDPPGHEAYASETLLRIDPSFLCYRPPGGAPDPEPGPRNGGIVFGSFNSAPKINRDVVRVWARVLRETPGSTLLLKALEFYDSPLGEDIAQRFEREGIESGRVHIHTLRTTLEEHLGLYRGIDVALDTFPYNGTTTTCEALFMGVPVITIEGHRHVARVSGAILTNLGRPHWIARDEDDYVRLASSLAHAPAAGSRTALRQELLRSVLCDGRAFAARFEGALREAWRRWCSAPR